jgi:mannose-1-phosphate guanylyltransferase/phosphomannomutase
MRTGQGAILPAIGPGPDAVATLVHLLGLLAAQPGRSLGDMVAEVPAPFLAHAAVPCGWAAKGAVMRRLIERTRRRRTDTSDGLRILDRDAWVQIVPDVEEPLVHVFAEARTRQAANRLRDSYVTLVAELLATPEVGAALAEIP